MLVLTVKPGQRVLIGDTIVVALLGASGAVRLGFEAPGLGILRETVAERIRRKHEPLRNPLLG